MQRYALAFSDRPSSRLYCNPKALWKLNWFLRDFGYDTELLGRDEVDEAKLIGLRGVVKISHIVCNGVFLLRLDGFARVSQWEELSPANLGRFRLFSGRRIEIQPPHSGSRSH